MKPANVHGRHSFPGVGFWIVSFHGIQAAGAIIAPGNIKHALQYRHPRAASPAQHVGNGSPCITLEIGKRSK